MKDIKIRFRTHKDAELFRTMFFSNNVWTVTALEHIVENCYFGIFSMENGMLPQEDRSIFGWYTKDLNHIDIRSYTPDVIESNPMPYIILPEPIRLDVKEEGKSIEGINDGGERITYGEDGAMREPSTGKGRFDLISPFGLQRIARWYELGSLKYAERNWEKGIPFSRCMDSAMRHLNKYMMGMSDEDHLAAAAWNVIAMMHYEQVGRKDLDDLPHYVGELCKRFDEESNKLRGKIAKMAVSGLDDKKEDQNEFTPPTYANLVENTERRVDPPKSFA